MNANEKQFLKSRIKHHELAKEKLLEQIYTQTKSPDEIMRLYSSVNEHYRVIIELKNILNIMDG